jgi:hypothetical protein
MVTHRKEAGEMSIETFPGVGEIPAECISPPAPPWEPFNQCLTWFDSRVLNIPLPGHDRVVMLQFLLVFEHCLQLEGRKQGPLLFTTTLLPQEKMKLYHYERYRRARSETDTVSVHTSFREYVSALHQNWGQTNTSKFDSDLTDVRQNVDKRVGTGGLLSFFGVDAGVSENTSVQKTHLSEVSVQTVAGEFDQKVRTASQAIDAERSVVVSTFEEKETSDVTQREIRNDNDCRAVTYFVRRVMEVYRLRTKLIGIYWRPLLRHVAVANTAWRSVEDLEGLDAATRKEVTTVVEQIKRNKETVASDHEITLPTDGTLYEAELAHCSSCEPEKEAEHAIARRKATAEAALLEAEVQRRQALLAAGKLDPFTPAPASDDES